MEAESVQRRPWVVRVRFPFLASSTVDDIALVTLLAPIWWLLGVEQFIWFVVLPVLTVKMLWKRRGRVLFPSVALLFALFLAAYLLSGFAIQDVSQVDSFLRKYAVFFSAFLLFMILINSMDTWRDVQKVSRVVLLMMGMAAAMGMLGILGVWRPLFEAPAVAHLPAFITQTAVGSYIAKRVIGHNATFLSFVYYRVNSIFLFPIVYATALAVVLPLSIYAVETARHMWRKAFWAAVAGMLFINLIYTTGRIALIGFLAGGVYYLLFVRHRRPVYQKVFVILALGSLGLLLLFVLLSPFVPFFRSAMDALISALLTRSTDQRLVVYQFTLEQVLQKPIFGWGTELDVTGLGLPAGSHGLYLALLYRQGMVGLLTFGAALAWLMYSGRPFTQVDASNRELVSLNKLLQYGQWCIAAALIDGLGTVPTFDVTTMVVLWFIFSLVIAARRIGRHMLAEAPEAPRAG